MRVKAMGFSPRPSTARTWFLEGALSALVISALMVAARFLFGYPTFFDLAENWITRLIPASVFAFLLDRLYYSAKPLLFVGFLLGQVVVGGLAAILYERLRSQIRLRRNALLAALLFGVVLWLVVVLGMLPLFGQGILGQDYTGGPFPLDLYLLVASVSYAALLALLGTSPRATVDRSRRQFLGGLAAAASAFAVLSVADRLVLTPTATPSDTESFDLGPTLASVPLAPLADPAWAIPGLGPEITPNKDFYAVTKNLFADPDVATVSWSLKLGGLVQRPLQFRYDELTRLPAVEFYQTLECISNPVGGDLMSTAWWRGVRLADLLNLAGVNPKASRVVFRAADGYADSVPFAAAMDPATTLVYQMNGQQLPRAHGFPVRLLTPGVYGLKNVKWLTEIDVIEGDFEGYWQERGWSNTAFVQTMSRVDAPARNATVPAGQVTIAGVAYSGDKGISRVEVSLDSGKTWEQALLKPALGPRTWRFWRYDANLPAGSQSAIVRAVDGKGQPQWEFPQDTLPDGATGTDIEVFTTR